MQRRAFFRVVGAGVTTALVALRAGRDRVVAGRAVPLGTLVFADDGRTVLGVWDGTRVVTYGPARVLMHVPRGTLPTRYQALSNTHSLSRTP